MNPLIQLKNAIPLFLLALACFALSSAEAATFTVDSTADAVDANPGDAVCATVSGQCTLRAAIQESNALPGADTITLPASTYTLAIPGAGEDAAATGDLDITDDLTINGAGAAVTIIDANALDRIFDIVEATDVTVAISGVTVTHGEAFGGGGIRYGSSLTLTDCIIRDNLSMFTGGGLESTAGLFDEPRLTLIDSIVTGNSAPFFGGHGGGIDADSSTSLMITRSEISHNTGASGGGGISAALVSEPPILTEVTVTGNSAGPGVLGDGGGIEGSCLILDRCTISNNTSSASGGGLSLVGNCGATITNSTISGNASDTFGGGIATGTLSLLNVTVADNSAAMGGGGIFLAGMGSSLTVLNTIVAYDVPGDCGGLPLTSAGHNIDSDGTCNLTDPSDFPNTDPLLGPLQDNGGPTVTHALLPGSPAIDHGDDNACPATDQRNVPRPQGTGCDIGAYEATPTPTPPPPIVSFVIGDLSAVVGQHVTFWGAQWERFNALSDGPAPSSFKGYADVTTPDPANCLGTWRTRPGNSSSPPATLPSIIRVIVASSITKSGSAIIGNIPQMAIISVDPGYQPDPGHPGTGTVLSVSCP